VEALQKLLEVSGRNAINKKNSITEGNAAKELFALR